MADPIPIAWLRTVIPQKVIKGASDKVARYLKARKVPIVKIANRNHCERSEVLRVFSRASRIRAHIEEYGCDDD